MLTSSSNQYLRPEYLTPLPTTLDAKKSPLALLAQTCSQIGADPLPPSSTGSGSSSSKTTSSLLSSLHDVSGTGSNSVGSSSTSSSSSLSSNSTSHSGNSTSANNNPSGNSSGGSGNKKSKSNHHHVNVGVEHHPHPTLHHHRKSSNSSESKGGGKGGSGGGGGSGKSQSHQHDKSGEKEGGAGGETRFTPPLLGGSSSGVTNGYGGNGRNSTSPDGKSRVRTPSSSASKASAGSPLLSSSTTSNSSPREPGNRSPVTSTVNGNGAGSTSTSSSSSSSSGTTATAATTETILPKSSRDSPAILRASPAFSTSSSSAICPPMTVSSSKLNLNGPLGCMTNSELSSLSSLKSHGNPLPFPGLYPGLSSHAAAVSSATTTAGLPPYLHSYARLKAAAAANGTDHLAAAAAAAAAGASAAGGCRDPFCTGCQLGAPHLPSSLTGAKPCPAGCLQCDHHKSPFFNVNGCGTGGGVGQGFPFLPGFPLPSGFYSSAMANSSASQQPYVCNWIVGDTYCGKRFTSSDELLQHLRSHTSLSSAAAAAGQSSADPLAAYSHHPLLSGMNMNLNLSRTYPTPPLSPLSSARFHPYSKPGGGLGSLSGIPSLSGLPGSAAAAAAAAAGLSSFTPPAGFSSLSHPLSPYYPYAAFYGQRLGSSSILHP